MLAAGGSTEIAGAESRAAAAMACAAAPTVIIETAPPTTPRAHDSGGALHMSVAQHCPTPELCSELHWAWVARK